MTSTTSLLLLSTISPYSSLFRSPSDPRQQEPSLFPYTTLFRSPWIETCAPFDDCVAELRVRRDNVARYSSNGQRPRLEEQGACQRPDRKSTRLNSSHPSISYAVFCLKKKK